MQGHVSGSGFSAKYRFMHHNHCVVAKNAVLFSNSPVSPPVLSRLHQQPALQCLWQHTAQQQSCRNSQCLLRWTEQASLSTLSSLMVCRWLLQALPLHLLTKYQTAGMLLWNGTTTVQLQLSLSHLKGFFDSRWKSFFPYTADCCRHDF